MSIRVTVGAGGARHDQASGFAAIVLGVENFQTYILRILRIVPLLLVAGDPSGTALTMAA